ncbi:E3 ubiquitin-protein ligase RNF149 [Notechis scutatus]|uniref:E3 ubiquitin-protein ligase RNF149 n=1 Tax=Notechis scutatus TaxID=8663 RepID=A0A6J1TWV5_9SAUR|nr:E3 ubiquitin-protein ligase RNF149 [Notechis scutatus]
MGLLSRRVTLPLLFLAAGGWPRVSWSLVWYTAWVSTVYTEPATNRTVRDSGESGRYGNSSPKESAQGLVGIPFGGTGRHMEGCDPKMEYNIPMAPGSSSGEKVAGAPFSPPQSWIALVAHGGCHLKDKVANAARKKAAAVVIYNEPRFGNSTLTPVSYLGTANTVVIMVGYPKGMEILEPVLRGISVKMTISVGKQHVQEYINGQSVVFVAIAFITMMIISLAWLIFFYVQRFLYSGSQFRSQGQREETIDAIAQLPLYTLKDEDKCWAIDTENCAICIENYKAKDTVRLLPCKHIFHKLCIDPWLLEQRTCPMCKLDIMKALEYWGGSQKIAAPESMSNIPTENWNISMEEDSNETSGLSASCTSSIALNNVLKENLCETTVLLERESGDDQHDHSTSGSLQI